ncbi:MAG: HypC/HybG/HupF family hydrogenase formation chaperone [candidate division Zixibacteria bacterium]|nr:HypC/HybG/HupF family hydrogenase formation chaperone [candidate division Zixibacteria bacterium]
MCLAVPGKITELFDDRGTPMGKVDFEGTVVPVCLAFVPEASVGDYVIVHAGFALNVIDEDEARLSLSLIAGISQAIQGDPDQTESD